MAIVSLDSRRSLRDFSDIAEFARKLLQYDTEGGKNYLQYKTELRNGDVTTRRALRWEQTIKVKYTLH